MVEEKRDVSEALSSMEILCDNCAEGAALEVSEALSSMEIYYVTAVDQNGNDSFRST